MWPTLEVKHSNRLGLGHQIWASTNRGGFDTEHKCLSKTFINTSFSPSKSKCVLIDLPSFFIMVVVVRYNHKEKHLSYEICTFVLISLRKFNFHTIWFEETLMKMVILSRGYFLSFIVISLKLRLYPQWEEELHH